MEYLKIKDESKSISDWIIKIRRELHEHPELMYEEFKTSELIRRELDKLEITYKHPVAETGVLAKRLKEMGHDVHCADIDPGNFRLEGVPFTKVNLNEPIDLPCESFDTVVCANGVHRLFNLGSCLREFARVLRANGSLFINFNNYASIERRLRFLFYGSIDNAINDW